MQKETMRPAGRIITYMPFIPLNSGSIPVERRVALMLHRLSARRGCGVRGAPALPMRTAMERRPYRCGAADREPPFPFSGL